MVVLERARASDRDAVRLQLSAYLLEFAEMQGVRAPLSEDGVPLYRWFDLYWSADDRIPFLVRARGRVAGFCLVRVMDGGWNVAEFGVDPEWRRRGIGRQAVDALAGVAEQAGATHLRADVHAWNGRALSFWQSCGFTPEPVDGGIVQTRRTLGIHVAGCQTPSSVSDTARR